MHSVLISTYIICRLVYTICILSWHYYLFIYIYHTQPVKPTPIKVNAFHTSEMYSIQVGEFYPTEVFDKSWRIFSSRGCRFKYAFFSLSSLRQGEFHLCVFFDKIGRIFTQSMCSIQMCQLYSHQVFYPAGLMSLPRNNWGPG